MATGVQRNALKKSRIFFGSNQNTRNLTLNNPPQPTIDLGPFLTNQFGDKYLYSVNRHAFDKIGADATFHNYFGANFLKENSIYIIVGTDSGLLIKYFDQTGIPEGAKCIFVELQEVLEKLYEAIDFSQLSSKIKATTFQNLNEVLTDSGLNDYIYLNKVYLLESLSAQDAYLVEYNELNTAVHHYTESNVWQVRAGLGNLDFFLRQMENLAENLQPFHCLNNIFSGKTAVVLGGGPSLDDIIPWIKENSEHLVILAVSRISRRLQEVDISPHIVFSIDPQLLSFDYSREMLNFSEKTLFANYFHVSPPLLGQWAGQSVYMGPRLPWKISTEETDTLSKGPTVTHNAMLAAIKMGFSQIILGGVDLCFTQKGYTHAKGSHEYQNGPSLTSLAITVRTNDGRLAETTNPYKLGISSMAALAELAQTQGASVINPAAGAAQIPHVKYIPLKDITCPPLDRSPEKTIMHAMPETTPKNRINHYNSMLDELKRTKKQLNGIESLCVKAIKANDALFGRNGKKADFKHKKQMDQIEDKLNTGYQDLSVIIKKLGIQYFLKLIRPDRNEWTDKEVELVGRNYYKAYLKSTKELISYINNTENRLKSRIEEEKEEPDFELLLKRWKDDLQPGRAVLWKNRHPAKAGELSPAVLKQFDELTEEYYQIIRREKNLTNAVSNYIFPAADIKAKAATFFKRRDKKGLQRMLAGLAEHSNQEAQPLSCLIKGFRAELDNNPEQALIEYQKLLTEESPHIEDSLKRITSLSLSLEDFENALNALECLANISPVYKPKYADLLWVLGENRQALDLYADYFDRVPGDLANMLKLGNYYKELNLPEGVLMAANYILEKEPDNQAAKLLLDGIRDN